MSKIKIVSNASGTGVYTIESPSSNDNRTLTLPSNGGNLVTTGDSNTITNDMISTNFLRFDLIAEGAFTTNFTLSETAANFDMLFVHYDLSTGTQTIASTNATDQDWERTLWLSPHHIQYGYSYVESTDQDDFAVIGTTFYYHRGTQTNNIVRQVYGVKFRGA
jgi:hypothetical protein